MTSIMDNELLTKTQLEAWNNSFEISSLKKENAELQKQIRELKGDLKKSYENRNNDIDTSSHTD